MEAGRGHGIITKTLARRRICRTMICIHGYTILGATPRSLRNIYERSFLRFGTELSPVCIEPGFMHPGLTESRRLPLPV